MKHRGVDEARIISWQPKVLFGSFAIVLVLADVLLYLLVKAKRKSDEPR
jgi:hypothetical protein